MKRTDQPSRRIPESRSATFFPKNYQPGKAEMEEELSEQQLCEVCFRPFTFVPKNTWLQLGSCQAARMARSIAEALGHRRLAPGS